MGHQQVSRPRTAVDFLHAIFAADVIARVVRVVWCADDLHRVGQPGNPAISVPNVPAVRVGDPRNSNGWIRERDERKSAVLRVVLNPVDIEIVVAVASIEPHRSSPMNHIAGRDIAQERDALKGQTRQR